MGDYRKTETIFDLMQRVRKGDSAAESKLRKESEAFFDLPGKHHFLVLVSSDIEHVKRCYLSSACSFWIPESFELVKVDVEGDVYRFLGKSGQVQTGTQEQLVRTGFHLPWGSNRVTARHVERAFQTCHIENDVREILCPPIGTFKIHCDIFSCDEYSWQNRPVNIVVNGRTKADLEQCVNSMIQTLEGISELDAAARKEFATFFEMTDEEVQELPLNDLMFYIDGEFDMLYLLPEDAGIEYVQGTFSADQRLLEVTIGNY